MVEAQTPWFGDGLCVRRLCERAASAIRYHGGITCTRNLQPLVVLVIFRSLECINFFPPSRGQVNQCTAGVLRVVCVCIVLSALVVLMSRFECGCS